MDSRLTLRELADQIKDRRIAYLEVQLSNPFSEQIRAKDKWIDDLLKEIQELKNERKRGK